MSCTVRHRVRFDAGEERSGPFTWGQIAVWEVLRWLGPDDDSLNLVGRLPVASGRTVDVDRVGAALRTLLERHESLRSVFRGTGDGPVQTVRAGGVLDLVEERLPETAHDAADDAVRALAKRLRAGAFRPGELPVRAGVVTRGGQAHAVVLVLHHQAADGSSLGIVLGDLSRLLEGTRGLPPRARQPVDRAAFEASPAGRRLAARTEAFWTDCFASVGPAMLAEEPGEPDFAWGRLDSVPLARTLDGLAERAGVGPLAVLLAAVSLLLSRASGEPDVLIRSLISTRFRPEDRELVGAFNLNGVFLLHLGESEGAPEGDPEGAPDGGAYADLARAAARAHVLSLRFSEAHPGAVESVVRRALDRGGHPSGAYCFFNNMVHDRPSPPPDGPWQTVVRAVDSEERQKGSKFFLFLEELSGRLSLSLCADRRFLRDGPVPFLTALDRLLVGWDQASEHASVSADTSDRAHTR